MIENLNVLPPSSLCLAEIRSSVDPGALFFQQLAPDPGWMPPVASPSQHRTFVSLWQGKEEQEGWRVSLLWAPCWLELVGRPSSAGGGWEMEHLGALSIASLCHNRIPRPEGWSFSISLLLLVSQLRRLILDFNSWLWLWKLLIPNVLKLCNFVSIVCQFSGPILDTQWSGNYILFWDICLTFFSDDFFLCIFSFCLSGTLSLVAEPPNRVVYLIFVPLIFLFFDCLLCYLERFFSSVFQPFHCFFLIVFILLISKSFLLLLLFFECSLFEHSLVPNGTFYISCKRLLLDIKYMYIYKLIVIIFKIYWFCDNLYKLLILCIIYTCVTQLRIYFNHFSLIQSSP